MVINTKENFFSKWLKIHKVFYGKSWKHWGNSFILHATDVNWRVTVFSIAQVFLQCNFTIASNYSIELEKNVRQEKCCTTAKFNSYGCDQKHTPQISLHIKFSFHRIIYKFFLPFIGRDRRSAVIYRKCHDSSQHNSKMDASSNELQGRIQIHYQTLSSLKWSCHPDIKCIPGFRSDWIGRFAQARKQKPKIYFSFILITLCFFPSGFVFISLG